jgi:ribose 5-phosphate isomerase RpiB
VRRPARSGSLARVRVYLGSDHAGFKLEARLIEWLTSAGHEPVDCGPPAYVPDDDYPASGRAVPASRTTGSS